MTHILVFDDDPNTLNNSLEELENNGYRVTGLSEISDLYTECEKLTPTVIVLRSVHEKVVSMCNELYQMQIVHLSSIIVYHAASGEAEEYGKCEKYAHHVQPEDKNHVCIKILDILNK
ncbi:MAG: hypothetical protein NVS3B19_15880 [Ginsengibacter sp.]